MSNRSIEHKELVLDNFPPGDDLWWVRWVDRYSHPHPGTRTVSVKVTLERLHFRSMRAAKDCDLSSLVKASDAWKRGFAHPGVLAGLIPSVRIGNVYRRRKYLSELPFPERTFSIDTRSTPRKIQRAYELVTPPGSWNSPAPSLVIKRDEFYLPDWRNSRFVVFRCPDMTVLIPCQEVFRIFYAQNSNLALTLTSGYWELKKDQLIDPEETRLIPPDIWRVVLQPGVPTSSTKIAAYLSIDEHASRAARTLTSIMQNPSKRADIPIEADIPFPPGMFQFRARHIELGKHDGIPKFLVTSISAVKWPYEGVRIEYEHKDGGSDVDRIAEGKNDPPVELTVKPSSTEIDPRRHILDSSHDPDIQIAAVRVEIPGFKWDEPPPETRTYREGTKRNSEITVVPGNTEVSTTSSGGNPGSERTNSGPADHELSRRVALPERFSALISVLEELKYGRGISDWNPVPSTDECPRMRGNTCVWSFPDKSNNTRGNWSYLLHPTRRAALVCRVERNNKILYLMELECRRSETGYRYVLFIPRPDKLNECIGELLQLAANEEGIWPSKPADHPACPSVQGAIPRKHLYTGGQGTDSNEPAESNKVAEDAIGMATEVGQVRKELRATAVDKSITLAIRRFFPEIVSSGTDGA